MREGSFFSCIGFRFILFLKCAINVYSLVALLLLAKDVVSMTEKEIKHFYNSSDWKRKRVEILKRDNWECQDCVSRVKSNENLRGYERVINRANEVHHVKELREYPNLALEDDNLISLCTVCHNKRHGRETYRFNAPKERLTKEMW